MRPSATCPGRDPFNYTFPAHGANSTHWATFGWRVRRIVRRLAAEQPGDAAAMAGGWGAGRVAAGLGAVRRPYIDRAAAGDALKKPR